MTNNSLLKTLKAIETLNDKNGYYPTIQSIAEERRKTTPTIHAHVTNLCELGLVTKNDKGKIIAILPPPKNNEEGCPECSSGTEEKEWTHTVPTHEGEPHERTGEATYCKNPKCYHSLNPIQ